MRKNSRKCPNRYSLAVAVVGILAATYSFAEDVKTDSVVLEDVAAHMSASCFEFAARNQLPPLSIAIVDIAGLPVHLQRQAGASGTTAEVALLKAQTSARTRYPTAALATEDAAARDLYQLLKLTQIAGGVPILFDGELLGAVGVSGAMPELDAECATQAVEKMRSPHKA